MRTAIAVLLLSAATPLMDDARADQRWCAISSEGYTDCSFASIALCRNTVSGNGGNCIPEAPVGHRQPRTVSSAAPKDNLDALIERTNRQQDRKLQICRGC